MSAKTKWKNKPYKAYQWFNIRGMVVTSDQIDDSYMRNIINFIASGRWSRPVTLDSFLALMADAESRGIDTSHINVAEVKETIRLNYMSIDEVTGNSQPSNLVRFPSDRYN